MTNQGETSTALPEVSGSKGSKPSITAPTGQAPATLLSNDIFVGSGKEAVATSTLEVHYTLMAWSTGQVVESSWDLRTNCNLSTKWSHCWLATRNSRDERRRSKIISYPT